MRYIVSSSFALMFSSSARAGSHLLPVVVMYALGMRAEAAFWLLLVSIIGLQNLLFLGAPQVLIRMLSFGSARADDVAPDVPAKAGSADAVEEDWVPVPDLVLLMQRLFHAASVAITLLVALGGSLAVAKVAAQTARPDDSWLAWAVMLLLSPVRILILRHLTFLHGMGRVACPRFIDGACWTVSGLLAALIFALCHSLAAMAIAAYVPVLLAIILLQKKAAAAGWNKYIASARRDELWRAFRSVWRPAWRAGLGQSLSLGARQGSGIILAQYIAAAEVAGFLMAMNVAVVVMMLSSAPLQAALPGISKAYARNETAEHCRIARMALSRSLWLVTLVCGGIGIAVIPLLSAVGASGSFVSPTIWMLIALTLFAQRYGAVHLQHYSITNHIFWHWLDGATGIINIVLCLILIPTHGIWGAAVANFVSVLCLYVWVPGLYVRRRFNVNWPRVDLIVILPPLALLVGAILVPVAVGCVAKTISCG